jgi:hypothetical protein
MAENWFDLSTDALKDIKKIGEGIATITSTLGTVIAIHKTALQLVSALTTDLLNPQALIIKAAIAAAQSLLDQFLKDGARVHLLVVPIRKKPLYNLQNDLAMPSDPSEHGFTFNDKILESDRKAFSEAMAKVAQYDQGNEGFARTLVDALYDEDDVHRPDYDEDSAVFGAMILAGASNIVKAYELMRWIQNLLGAQMRGKSLLPHMMIKTAQNLRVMPISAEKVDQIAIQLTWENPPVLQTLAEFDGMRVRIKELLIVRSVNPPTQKAKCWADIFGPGEPVPLGDNEFSKADAYDSLDYKTSVAKIFKYDGVRNTYIDEDEDLLEKNVTYYYTVAYRYEIANPPDATGKVEYEQQKLFQISNVVQTRVNADKLPTSRRAVEPNWIATPNILSFVPEVAYLLRRVEAYLESLESLTVGAASALQSYVDFLIAEAARYQEFATQINNILSKLQGLFNVPTSGIYVTTYAADSGGIDALSLEFMKRLTDTTDSSAPPFHGQGVVAGLVFVSGAPNPANLTTVKTLFGLLFGSGTEAPTPFENAVESLDRLTAQAESLTLGADLQPGTAPTKPTVYKTFDKSLVGTDPSDPNTALPG